MLPKSKTVLTATHPQFLGPNFILKLLKPDIVFAQSRDIYKQFKSLSVKTTILPNGFDSKRFFPINVIEKERLRSKYSIPNEEFVLLHVGNLRIGRNLNLLYEISTHIDCYFIIIASTSIKPNYETFTSVKRLRGQIITDYVEDVSEFYKLSDCYIFTPQRRPFAIDMPLSVFEAFGCGIKIVSSPYCGLPEIFKETNKLRFFTGIDDLIEILAGFKNNEIINSEVSDQIAQRDLTWESVLGQVIRFYEF